MPSAGDIPDPMDDPEGFESYLATMYQDAGLSKDQSTCMASAFMDNIDLEAMTDPNAVSSAMNDPELTKAITKCM
ncbi:hypothetical protein [Nocardioides insulae]|uniref:hypothetical protein n=1 Tax=Nocardioides insulae TaxID=394734 RepID=UPI0003FACBBC|nr:hypothetical protein [Nocardioides insulae]